MSSEMMVQPGVPQSSILGPLLFILYINDIQNCSDIASMLLFADDTNIFYSHSCLKTLNETLQTEVDKIAEWLNTNKLSINTSKTKFILFRSSKKKKKHVVKLSINNDDIKQVKSTTFLGV